MDYMPNIAQKIPEAEILQEAYEGFLTDLSIGFFEDRPLTEILDAPPPIHKIEGYLTLDEFIKTIYNDINAVFDYLGHSQEFEQLVDYKFPLSSRAAIKEGWDLKRADGVFGFESPDGFLSLEEREKKLSLEGAKQDILQNQNELAKARTAPSSPTDKKKEVFDLLKTTAESYTDDPKKLAELFQFGSSFYNYSVNNTMLIYAQNPNASFVQSFKDWKEMQGVECSVKKGEKGLKVLAPVKVTVLNIDGNAVPLREATKEQAAAYKQGLIEGKEKLAFKIGTVFDISQTTFPKERYPELYTMGFPSEQHSAIIQGLTDFSKNVLDCPVQTVDMQSITLRGQYFPADNKIHLNEIMNDSEKLSTLAHELGHAMVHRNLDPNKSNAQIEFEADAVGIMIQSHCGIELSDLRKGHLASNYSALMDELKAKPETAQNVLKHSQQIFSSVFDTFKKNISPIQESIQKRLPDLPELEQPRQTQTPTLEI